MSLHLESLKKDVKYCCNQNLYMQRYNECKSQLCFSSTDNFQGFSEWILQSPKIDSQNFVVVTPLTQNFHKHPNAYMSTHRFYFSLIRRFFILIFGHFNCLTRCYNSHIDQGKKGMWIQFASSNPCDIHHVLSISCGEGNIVNFFLKIY
jgi:hypothetical protein